MEDKNKLYNDFDEDEFMLNKKVDDIFSEDSIIDTFDEDNSINNIEIEDLVKAKEDIVEVKEPIPTREEHRKNKTKKVKVKKEKKTKKISKKSALFQRIFNIVSVAFVIACCIFYGTRMLKYYKMYHPKGTNGQSISLAATSILGGVTYSTEGDGVYKVGGSTIYEGNIENNYFKFSNMLWRIISINKDKTIELVLDDSINSLYYAKNNTSYYNSDIREYLNKEFIKYLDTSYLTPTNICKEYTDEENITCKEYDNTNYVRLLSMKEFINTIVDSNTYLGKDYGFWLLESSKDSITIANGNNISKSDANVDYHVRPVIKLKDTNVLLGGDGTLENPYHIEKTQPINIGNYIKIDNDIWVIYDINDKQISLALNKNIVKTNVFSYNSNLFDPADKYSAAAYLNNTYYESLSYKDKLLESSWNIGKYIGEYKTVSDKTVFAKVGLLSASDIKLNLMEDVYVMLTPSEDNTITYFNDGLTQSKINLVKSMKPTIKILKENITSGSGSLTDPYVVGGTE